MSLPKAIPYARFLDAELLRTNALMRAQLLHFKNADHQAMHHEAAFSLLPDLKNRTLLDFGCGLGDFTGQLPVDMQDRYLGTDMRREAIDLARVLNPGWKFKRQKKVVPSDLIVAVAVLADGYRDPVGLLADMWARCGVAVVFTAWRHLGSEETVAAMCPKPPDVIFYRDDFLAAAMYK